MTQRYFPWNKLFTIGETTFKFSKTRKSSEDEALKIVTVDQAMKRLLENFNLTRPQFRIASLEPALQLPAELFHLVRELRDLH